MNIHGGKRVHEWLEERFEIHMIAETSNNTSYFEGIRHVIYTFLNFPQSLVLLQKGR